MSDFTLLRDRDAWATIRGYVYQMDLTILRWLDLQDGQIIELERGEDIDLVSNALGGPTDEGVARILEQVKHRDRAITLRAPTAIAAIANAIEHSANNAGVALAFRYTTNARIGTESLSPMPGRIPAISAWGQIHQGILDSAELAEVLRGLHTILEEADRPEGLTDCTWRLFRTFVLQADDASMLDLIRRFEWSTGIAEMPVLRSHVQRVLLEREIAADTERAQDVYHRLFFHVMTLLCQPGIKRLTLEDRSQILALPPLNDADRESLTRINLLVSEIEGRVGMLEGTSLRHERALAGLNAQVLKLARQQGITASLVETAALPVLDIPPLVAVVSRRAATVDALLQVIADHTWVSVSGNAGLGKTQLAVLIAERLGTCRAWMRFRGLTEIQAITRLDMALSTLVHLPPQSSRRQWYARLCESLGGGVFLVLDDLPQITSGDELSECLGQLASACCQSGVRLLSTSPYQLPLSLHLSLGERILQEMPAPPFDNDEASDILRGLGAPAPLLSDKAVGFINALAGGHPQLLVEIARYLGQRRWRFTDEALEGLLRGEYASALNDETNTRIARTVQDEDSRELLYRLSLIVGDFSGEDMQAVASVIPAVKHPVQCLNSLLGLWVQRDAHRRYLLSPLVASSVKGNLLNETEKACRLVLGDRLVQRRRLNEWEVSRALIYYTGAEEFDRAGGLLALSLSQLARADQPTRNIALLSTWIDQPLPLPMRLDLRIFLRALQASLLYKAGKPISYILDDLDALIDQAGAENAWAVLGASAVFETKLAELEPARANRFALRALQFLPHLTDVSEKSERLPTEISSEGFIWAAVMGITTADDLHRWIVAVQQLPEAIRQRAFMGEVGEQGCMIVSDRLWLREADKPQNDRQWDAVLVALDELGQYALAWGSELLGACAVRAKMIVHAEYLRDLPAALDIGQSALAQASADPRTRFVIKECIGRQLLYQKNHTEALVWLRDSLAEPTDSYPTLHVQSLLNMGQAVVSEDPKIAVAYVSEAVNRSRAMQEATEVEMVKVLGEQAVAHWLAGDLPSAFTSWDEAGERLLNSKSDTPEWKDTFVVYAHTSGYLTSMAWGVAPPQTTRNNEPYVAPFLGLFNTYNPARWKLYDPEKDCYLATQLATFAEAVGRDDRAAAWASKGSELARAAHAWLALGTLNRDRIPYLLLDDRYAEVLDSALESEPILLALRERSRAGDDPLLPHLDPRQLVADLPTELLQMAERWAAWSSLVPIAFRLGTMATSKLQSSIEQTQAVAGLCRQVARRALDSMLWTQAATLFEDAYVERVRGIDLIGRSNSFDTERYSALKVVGYLVAAQQPDLAPSDVLRAQLAVLPTVYTMFRPPSAIYRCIVLPFLDAFWRNVFEHMRFRFRAPHLVETELSITQKRPDTERAQRLCEIIAFGLGVKLTPDLQKWVSEKPSA